ncbi:MAG: succinate--CoA ligase subunit alpha [Candidatus Omnitrophica bacterium]|nr:succinate--CoA ligase subunit alpha [Candidatus Omnitrophota bacterium]
MSIWLKDDTRVLCQGVTGEAGAFHTKLCKEYGTRMVAGVSPGKGGQSVEEVRVFDTCEEAVLKAGAEASMIFVPARFAKDAILEAAHAGIRLIVCITEGIPTWEMVEVKHHLKGGEVRLIGPNCPGIITPGESKIGIMPGYIHRPGEVGVISRSGTLTYEVVYALTQAGLGQSTCIGIGGDPVIGTSFIDCLEAFGRDEGTRAVVMIGEIGGLDEESAAAYIRSEFYKPVVGFIAGRCAPKGRRMGHAGAIVSGSQGTADAKIEALRSAGVKVADYPWEIPGLVKESLHVQKR